MQKLNHLRYISDKNDKKFISKAHIRAQKVTTQEWDSQVTVTLSGIRAATPKYAFWDLDHFKLVIFKKQKTQAKPFPFPETA